MTVRQRRPQSTSTEVSAPPPPPRRSSRRVLDRPILPSSIRSAILPFFLAYTTILSFLILSPIAQRHLTYLNLISLNPIFPPKDPTRYCLHGRPITINHVNGWHIPPPHPPTNNFTESLSAPGQRVIIYHHGNAGTRAWPRRVEAVRILAHSFHAHVLSFDYTGFGDTPGSPSESKLYADSESVYHWARENTNDADIWLYGQSLGTFPAVELGTRLCEEPRPRGVVLEAPPASLIDAAMTHPAAKAFRIFPRMREVFEAVLWEKLDNIGKIRNVCLPMLIMHGDQDDMIPMEQGETLYEAARMGGVDVEFFRIEGHGHKDVNAAVGYLRIVKRFLDKYARIKVPEREVGNG